MNLLYFYAFLSAVVASQSCTKAKFDHKSSQESKDLAADSDKTPPEDDIVDEPVAVGGAFLVQEMLSDLDLDDYVAIGVRIENAGAQKLASIAVASIGYRDASGITPLQGVSQARTSRYHVLFFAPKLSNTAGTSIELAIKDQFGQTREFVSELSSIVAPSSEAVLSEEAQGQAQPPSSAPSSPSVEEEPSDPMASQNTAKVLTFIGFYGDGVTVRRHSFLSRTAFCQEGGVLRSNFNNDELGRSSAIQRINLPYAKPACFMPFDRIGINSKPSYFSSNNGCLVFILLTDYGIGSYIARKDDAPSEGELQDFTHANRCAMPTRG